MDDDELQHLPHRKDELFRHHDHSPIPAEQRGSSGGLRYSVDGEQAELVLLSRGGEALSCPMTPPESWLRVPLPAGEAAYAP